MITWCSGSYTSKTGGGAASLGSLYTVYGTHVVYSLPTFLETIWQLCCHHCINTHAWTSNMHTHPLAILGWISRGDPSLVLSLSVGLPRAWVWGWGGGAQPSLKNFECMKSSLRSLSTEWTYALQSNVIVVVCSWAWRYFLSHVCSFSVTRDTFRVDKLCVLWFGLHLWK